MGLTSLPAKIGIDPTGRHLIDEIRMMSAAAANRRETCSRSAGLMNMMPFCSLK
jgi:hypothetical protein